MSYILDALKRADSERERGSIPGIHAQPAPLVPADAPSHGRLKPWLWLVLVLPAVLLGLLAWRTMAPEIAQEMTRPVAAVPVLTPPAPAQQAAPAIPAPAAQSDAATPRSAPPPAIAAPSPQTGPPPPKPLPALQTAAAPAAPPVKQQVKVPATTATKADAPAGAAPSENRIASLNELPEDIRRQLPALTISGSSYSENPAHRMLIINGQVFHEGEKPTAELVLEQIKPNAAVLSFRGYRYSLGY